MTNVRVFQRLAGFLLLAVVQQISAADVTLSVEPHTDSTEPTHADVMHSVSTGGFTPFLSPSPELLRELKAYGMLRMRLINVDRDVKLNFGDDGSMSVLWPDRLENQLRICKKFGFVPHIIIGQEAPDLLRSDIKDRMSHGPTSWETYAQYVRAILDHVHKDHGFQTTVWEVGNELDNPKFNWISKSRPQDKLNPESYRDYLRLYTNIAEAIDEYREQNANYNIKVGGAALTQNSFNYPVSSPRNWMISFTKDVLDRNVPIDFLSMHFYGSAGSRDEFEERLNYLKIEMSKRRKNLPIWITEWGPTAFFANTGSVNYSVYAGAFALSFVNSAVDYRVDDLMFVAAREKPGKTGPSLFMFDDQPTHVMKALYSVKSIASMRPARCSASDHDVHCLSGVDADGTSVVFWRSDWDKKRAPGAWGESTDDPKYITLRIRRDHDDNCNSTIRIEKNGAPILPLNEHIETQCEGELHIVRLSNIPLYRNEYSMIHIQR